MNWKQNLADYFGWKNFEDMDTSDQRTAEKAVELYQKELNEKLKNVGLAVSEFFEEKKDKFDKLVEETIKGCKSLETPKSRRWFGRDKR